MDMFRHSIGQIIVLVCAGPGHNQGSLAAGIQEQAQRIELKRRLEEQIYVGA